MADIDSIMQLLDWNRTPAEQETGIRLAQQAACISAFLKMQSALKKAALEQHFRKRGNACFRIVGDGILQVVKFEYERAHSHYALCIGLFSLYGELLPQWLTSWGCIPYYSAMSYMGRRMEVLCYTGRDNCFHIHVTPWERQLDVFCRYAIPTLNAMQTQEELVHELCRLDKIEHDMILWPRMEKFAPFLKTGDNASAQKVIMAYLSTHGLDLPEDGNYAAILPSLTEEQQALVQKLILAGSGDKEAIQSWLNDNYTKNLALTKFISR